MPVAKKPESQDICFVPSGSYAGLVKQLRPDACKPGEVVDMHGNILGFHDGIAGFTVGQRRGLGVAKGEPQYVLRIDPSVGRVVIGPKTALLKENFILRNINWLGSGDRPRDGMEVEVKIRSSSTPVIAKLFLNNVDCVEVKPKEPISSVAPGQACVFYSDRRVLGGGWIMQE